MRSVRTALLGTVLVAAIGAGLLTGPAADAAARPRVFANCTQLAKVYPHGVGRTGAHDKGTGKSFRPVTTFKRDTATYQANTKLDRDRDGVACEKR